MDAVARLDNPNRATRLEALREIADSGRARSLHGRSTPEVNNHVHTIYSFSPYSPARAALKAAEAGLQAVGIMDHDSVSGCEEMLEAGRALAIATTAGFEARVNASGTALEGRKINNPDSPNILYMAVHGIPSRSLPAAKAFLDTIGRARMSRNREMVAQLNGKLASLGIPALDFERDVAAISCAAEGGSITERHILCALSKRIASLFPKGEKLLDFLSGTLRISLPPKLRAFLADDANPHFIYDLLGVLKSSFLPEFFIQPTEDECPPVRQVVELALSLGAIPAYAYLGDVTESPTGDKKAEKFEDDFLDLLFDELTRLGFQALTYMPPRNTPAQLRRVQSLCARHGLMEISGVDINSSRQEFNCPIILQPDFSHLVDATWALIAHEKLAQINPAWGLFSPDTPIRSLPLPERIARYAKIGRGLDPECPERSAERVSSP